MVKLISAIALIFVVAALSIGGSPLFAVLLVVPALLLYSVIAGTKAPAHIDEAREEDDPDQVLADPEMPSRPAGTEADRAHRRERAERLRSSR